VLKIFLQVPRQLVIDADAALGIDGDDDGEFGFVLFHSLINGQTATGALICGCDSYPAISKSSNL
jgi:hypothetical protein